MARNLALREALGWEEEIYERIKARLVERGQITRGRGGSVMRADVGGFL